MTGFGPSLLIFAPRASHSKSCPGFRGHSFPGSSIDPTCRFTDSYPRKTGNPLAYWPRAAAPARICHCWRIADVACCYWSTSVHVTDSSLLSARSADSTYLDRAESKNILSTTLFLKMLKCIMYVSPTKILITVVICRSQCSKK